MPYAGGGKYFGMQCSCPRARPLADAVACAEMLLPATSPRVSRLGQGPTANFPGPAGHQCLASSEVGTPRQTRAFVGLAQGQSWSRATRNMKEAAARFGSSGHTEPLDKRTAVRFLGNEFRLADASTLKTSVNKEDLEGIGNWMRGAKKQADWLVYGMHCHESGATGSVSRWLQAVAA